MQMAYGDKKLFNVFFLFVIEKFDFLELRQYKNNSGQSEKILCLKLPRLFSRRLGDEKTRQFQDWNCF